MGPMTLPVGCHTTVAAGPSARTPKWAARGSQPQAHAASPGSSSQKGGLLQQGRSPAQGSASHQTRASSPGYASSLGHASPLLSPPQGGSVPPQQSHTVLPQGRASPPGHLSPQGRAPAPRGTQQGTRPQVQASVQVRSPRPGHVVLQGPGLHHGHASPPGSVALQVRAPPSGSAVVPQCAPSSTRAPLHGYATPHPQGGWQQGSCRWQAPVARSVPTAVPVLRSGSARPAGSGTTALGSGRHWKVLPPTQGWVITYAPTACHGQQCAASPAASAPSPGAAWTVGLQFQDLPPEIVQCFVDLLPTFAGRARLRTLCRAAVGLEWRLAPPLRPEEELSGLGLGDLGARAVARAAAAVASSGRPALRELCLGGNGIGDAGATAIAAVLGTGSTLRRLSLRDNEIGDLGAEALALALSMRSELEELDLWGNCLTPAGKQGLLTRARCKVFLEVALPPQPRDAGLTMEATTTGGMMRVVLFDWISQVHSSSSAPASLNGDADPQEVLFRTFSHVDAYLALRPVRPPGLQLAGVACTLAAAAAQGSEDADGGAELAMWLASVTDGGCTEEEAQRAAEDVRKALGFRLHRPTAYTFLRRFLRKTGWTEESFSLANYLIELAALDAEFLAHRPQAIAAAAAVLSRQYLSQGIGVQHIPCWKARLLRCADVDLVEELAPCAAALSRLHVREHGRRGRFVNAKYEWARLHRVAKLAPNSPPDAGFFVGYLSEELAP